MEFNEKLKQFALTPYYIGLMALIAFVCWFFDILLVGIAVYALVFAYCMIFFKDTAPALPALILCTFMISRQLFAADYMPLVYGVAPVVLLSIAFYFIVHRPKLRGGRYALGLLLASVAMVTGGIGFDYRVENILSVAAFCLLILFIYFFFSNTAGEKLKDVVLNSFVAVTLVLLLQIAVYYLRQEDLLHAITRKTINVGWGISNNIGFVLSMMLPVLFYKAIASRFFHVFIALALFDFLGILFTLSRGNIIFGGVFLIFGLVFCFFKIRDKAGYLVALAVSLAAVFALGFALREYISKIYDWLIQLSSGTRSRINLLNEGLEAFKQNPVFGIGFFHLHEKIPHWFHNSFMQILASTGIIGSLLFFPFFYQRYIVPARNFNACSFLMLCSIVLSGLYALMECNFFFVYNLIFIMLEYIIIERERDTVDLFAKIRYKLFKKKDATR